MRHTWVMVAVASAWALSARVSQGDLVLTLSDLGSPGSTVVIRDNSAMDSAPAAGQIGVPFGGLGFVVGSFIVDPATFLFTSNDPLSAMMDLHLAVTSTGSGQFRATATQTDFTLDDSWMLWSSSGSIGGIGVGGSGDASVTFQYALDPSNNEFGFPGYNTLGPGTVSGGPFSDTLSSVVGGSNPFSLSQEVTITANGADQFISFDSTNEVMHNPEPVSLALWVLAAGIGALGVRRRIRARAAAQGA